MFAKIFSAAAAVAVIVAVTATPMPDPRGNGASNACARFPQWCGTDTRNNTNSTTPTNGTNSTNSTNTTVTVNVTRRTVSLFDGDGSSHGVYIGAGDVADVGITVGDDEDDSPFYPLGVDE